MVNSHDLFVEHVYPHPKKHPCMIYSYLHLVFFLASYHLFFTGKYTMFFSRRSHLGYTALVGFDVVRGPTVLLICC